ncbi:VanZ family protein [Myroides odoratus]|uniref:Predicted integral membrane protein n=1 Tax=Myroides odoratus TaxID=256 RepID=A0A378U484_MYROD|nr:VanZ family protein [Myroides odoratus]QQU02943.1 VanZ family protein [Myroides odoratus]STZ69821.1 Predicted integral membrane protein [Myroides odoratus]
MARKVFFIAGLLWTCFIIYACLAEASSIPKTSFFNIPNKDKVAHFTFYFVFSVIWFLFSSKKNSSKKTKIRTGIAIFTIATFLGGGVELGQYFFTNSRSAEWADFFANSLGSAIGILFGLLITTHKKK